MQTYTDAVRSGAADLHKFGDTLSVSFTEAGGSRVDVAIQSTPTGTGRLGIVTANEVAARRLDQMAKAVAAELSFETSPDEYERAVYSSLNDDGLNLAAAVRYAHALGCDAIQVRGLCAKSRTPTPTDGRVDETQVAEQIFYLVAAFGVGMGLKGFAYSSENCRHLLRAVCPVAALALQASSQGFANDLGWHMDNADRIVPNLEDADGRGPMNSYQAFASVNTDDDVPMEVLTLGDLVAETAAEFGNEVIDDLQVPAYEARPPQSHQGNAARSSVPVLFRDSCGHWHGRFHAENITALTQKASVALAAFKKTAAKTKSIIRWSEPGSLLIYSNTRCLHRRRLFQPAFDGYDRYYLRLYLTTTDVYREFADVRTGRVFL